MMSNDDDFQPIALPDLGDDLPLTDGILDEDPFVVPTPVHEHLIIDHPDGEHVMAPILAPDPLMAIPLEDIPFDDLVDIDVELFVDGPCDDAHGDEELDEDVVAIPLFEVPVVEISPDTSLHFVPDSFEFVTSSTLQAIGLRRYATDSDDNTAISVALSLPHDLEPRLEPDFVPDDQPIDAPADPEPRPAPEPLPDHDPIPFGLPDIAPLIPDPVPAPADPPVTEPDTPPLAHAPAEVAPCHSMESDDHRVELPIAFLQGIPTPCPGEGTSDQQPSHDPHVSAASPHIPQSAPFAHFTSSPTDEPFRGSPRYSMSTSDPYHPLRCVGYTQDEILYSLQFRLEVVSRRVLELETIPCPLLCPYQSTSVPLHSSPPLFARPHAPLTPFPEFDARFLTVEQQVHHLLRHVHKLEEGLAHVLSLIFLPPPPPPSVH
ncbi:hypothetical protein HanIR_Chr14g0692021 [Helianthus annuus]|nr:hypothetical protein HanIR_Chr14g0692021 [Helianthus annuus]